MADSTVHVMAAGLVAGVDYPMDTAQFRAWFPDDDACLDFLDWLRWPGGFVCPHCAAVSAGVDDRTVSLSWMQASGVSDCRDYL